MTTSQVNTLSVSHMALSLSVAMDSDVPCRLQLFPSSDTNMEFYLCWSQFLSSRPHVGQWGLLPPSQRRWTELRTFPAHVCHCFARFQIRGLLLDVWGIFRGILLCLLPEYLTGSVVLCRVVAAAQLVAILTVVDRTELGSGIERGTFYLYHVRPSSEQSTGLLPDNGISMVLFKKLYKFNSFFVINFRFHHYLLHFTLNPPMADLCHLYYPP